MKKLILALLVLGGTQANAAEYLVKYRNMKGLSQIHQMVAQKSNGMMVVDAHAPGSYVVIDFDETTEPASVVQLMSNPDIEWIHPNGQVETFENPFSPVTLQEQWSMKATRASEAWSRAGNQGDRRVIVAVIDTGVDSRHVALAPNMIPGYDFYDNDNDPSDVTSRMSKGHGTHCAGVIGATGLVDGGIIGLSPQVSIMPIRFLGPSGGGDFNNAIKSIDYAIANGAQVISASWGARIGRNQVRGLIEAVERASAKGVIFVVAAANNGQNNDNIEVYPANAATPNTISVAASNSRDGKPSWSNFGKSTVHIAAPGDSILSTIPKDGYMNMSGTSMATPMVAGLVALLKAQDPNLTGPQILALMQTTGAKVNIETACGCRIDAAAAVDHLLSKKPVLVPMAHTGEEGQALQMSGLNLPADLRYSSSNPEVMSVDESGNVTFLKGGTARVIATASDTALTTFDFIIKGSTGGGDQTECPYSERMCRWACWWNPNRPFCKK